MSEKLKAGSVAVRSIGCRTNQEEMTALKYQLQDQGYNVVENCADADIVVVNTCTVTAFTEVKTKRMIKKIHQQAPLAKIMVTGCMAQNKPDEFKTIQGINWIVGNTFKNRITSIVQNSSKGVYHCEFDENWKDSQPEQILIKKIHPGGKTRFPVKIQEGCDFGCAYCIVPSVRGPSRSYHMDQIIKVCYNAVDAGYKEIVITGTHIGQFRYGLVNLIRKILEKKGDFRIRLSSLDPRDLSSELLELISDNERVCDHLHVSLQSLSTQVLKRMERPYDSVSDLVGLLNEFREKCPHGGLGADLIAGFPGETDKMFDTTLKRVSDLNLSYAHVFRFSARPGTKACNMSDQIDEKTKSMRSSLLREAIEKSRALFIRNMKNVKKRIIVESEKPCRGLTSNYIHVEIPDYGKEKNSWLDVNVLPQTCGRLFTARVASEFCYD
ncbi:MAG: tRNA (N(6)-L-threonylcarbamoyladenosine(37)-C(2))-methylthiotransferase MtaB [Fibrobacter sp.]|nr:tRNA (N(6)-L-threonylcarbamoyladenosine(37)-C(2))-methylthiotransferase MtaB [Fibrobacter sp.]